MWRFYCEMVGRVKAWRCYTVNIEKMTRYIDTTATYIHLLIIFVSFPQSNYGAGLRILHLDTQAEDFDVHEVAYFDVLPTSQPTPRYEGTWSNYPYFASGQNNKISGNPLLWRHNGRDGVSNHQPHDCLFTQACIQTQIKENIKAPRHWPFCGEFTEFST